MEFIIEMLTNIALFMLPDREENGGLCAIIVLGGIIFVGVLIYLFTKTPLV